MATSFLMIFEFANELKNTELHACRQVTKEAGTCFDTSLLY
ncbi:MAG TPA: hypothetical protein VGE46_05070 [Bdellovibrio sp.]